MNDNILWYQYYKVNRQGSTMLRRLFNLKKMIIDFAGCYIPVQKVQAIGNTRFTCHHAGYAVFIIPIMFSGEAYYKNIEIPLLETEIKDTPGHDICCILNSQRKEIYEGEATLDNTIAGIRLKPIFTQLINSI